EPVRGGWRGGAQHQVLLLVAIGTDPRPRDAGQRDQPEHDAAGHREAVAAQARPGVLPKRGALLEADGFFHGAHRRACRAVRMRGLSQAARMSDSRLKTMISSARNVVMPRIMVG